MSLHLGNHPSVWVLKARRAQGNVHMTWTGRHVVTTGRLIAICTPPGTLVAHVTRNLHYALDHWCVAVFPLGDDYNVMADFDTNGDVIRTYVNMATSPTVTNSTIHWTDLYVDVVFRPNETPIIVDQDELENARLSGLLPFLTARAAKLRAKSIAASSSLLFRPHRLRPYLDILASGGMQLP